MTNQAGIQKHISKGSGIAANKLGSAFDQYRPLSTGPVIDPANLLHAQVNAGFDIDYRFSHRAPGGYGHPQYYILAGLDDIAVGDYFTNHDDTYFVAGFEPLRPPLVVSCNRVVSIYQPTPGAIGPDYYSGNVTGTGDPQVVGWPCSILIGPKGEMNASGLPADPRAPWHAVLFPRFPGLVIRTGDVMTDDLAHRYTLSAAELTNLGWRCTASYSGT